MSIERARELGLRPPQRPRGLRPATRHERLLVVAVDCSGSMGGAMEGTATRIQVAWRCLSDVLARHMGDWELGVLLFGEEHRVWWAAPPGDPRGISLLPVPVADGGTPMLPALRMAWSYLSRRARGGRIVLITDGEPNVDGGQGRILEEAPGHGVPIDTVGVGALGGYDPAFLRRLSTATGGIFCEAQNVAALASHILALAPVNRPALGRPG